MNSHYALCRSVGSGIPFVLGDGEDAVTVLLQPMRLVDWGVIEQMILLARKKSVVLEDMPPEVAESLKESLKVDRSATLDEIFDYASTPSGAIWRLWLSLRCQYPHSQCAAWVDTLTSQGRLGEYLAVASQIDGLDIFAAMDWPVLPFQEELAVIRKDKKSGIVDWKIHISGFAEALSLSPSQIGEQTFYQVRLLLWDREALQGKLKLTPEEHKAVVWERQRHRLLAEKTAAQSNVVSPLVG